MADKTKTVKGATDKELDELLSRLRKENHLVDLIAELKRKSTPVDPFNSEQSYRRPEISTEEPINSLYHYGIMGMRWGIRRKRGPDGRVMPGTRCPEHHPDHSRAREQRKRGAQSLSTEDLRSLNQRLQLEKQYKDLDPSAVKKGQSVVKGVIATGTTVTALYSLATSDAAQAIMKVIAPQGKDILKGRV